MHAAALFAPQFDDRFPLGRFVGQRRVHAGFDEPTHIHLRCRVEFGRLAVADGDGSRFVEQQRVDVAGRFDGLARFGDDVRTQRPVHSGDPDRRQQSPDRGRDQADEQRNERGDRDVGPHVVGEGFQRGANDHEYQREPGQQDRQRDFVRRFLPRSAFDERNHFVQETFARHGGHPDADAVGQHFRTARDGAFVAAGLADHRRAFAGNGAFVDRGEPLDDLAVGRDDVARLTFEDIVFFQRVAADDTNSIAVDQFGRGLLARFAQRIGLRFAARFGDRLCEIGEQQRNEQHDENDEVVSERPLGRIPRNEDVEQQDEHDGRDDLDGEHDRVFNHRPRIEFAYRCTETLFDELFIEQRIGLIHGFQSFICLNNRRSDPAPAPGKMPGRPR